jgi:Fuc2NAc and GlcNAc transferase
MIPWLLLAGFTAAALGTWLLRRYALARNVLDIPSDRSSHRVPTPRGGGLAIVVTFLAGVLILAGVGEISRALAVALVGAGGIVALIGFVDDHRHVAAKWRLVAHFVAATWALWWLGGLPSVQLVGGMASLAWLGSVLAALALVWLLNLYNFMDGIDGIAGVEAVTVCIAAVALYATRPSTGAEQVLPALLAAATLGFLIWNFPPAKIFMGDAGSGFLGLMLGVLAVRAAAVSPAWLWSWIILLGVFTVDATVTLVRRLWRREKVYQAHRSHAYQRAALLRGAHAPVSLTVAAINLVWLFPIALLVGTGRLSGATGTLIAYAPLVWLAVRLGAGTPTR